MDNFFPKNLKYLREKKNLSQNKLGELTGVNQTSIARWENEEVSPSIDNVIEVAKVFNLSLADLLGKDLSKNADVNTSPIKRKIDNLNEKELNKLSKLIDVIKDDDNKV